MYLMNKFVGLTNLIKSVCINHYLFCYYHEFSSVDPICFVVGSNNMKKFVYLTHLIKSII
jgi:hypothetical protein